MASEGLSFPFVSGPEEEPILASLYAYFDESGQFGQHPYVLFAGLVAGFEHWTDCQNKWLAELRQVGLSAWDTKKAVRYSQSYGSMKSGKPEDRLRDILPFVHAITDHIDLAVAVAVDVAEYKKAPQRLRRKYGPDPHYFAFDQAVKFILNYWEIPRPYTIGLICDDHEAKAIRCYKLLRKLKLQYPVVRQRVTSICFSDDKDHYALQAADLYAHVSRLEAELRFRNKPNPYNGQLKKAFEYVNPATGNHLHFEGGVFGDEELAEAAKLL